MSQTNVNCNFLRSFLFISDILRVDFFVAVLSHKCQWNLNVLDLHGNEKMLIFFIWVEEVEKFLCRRKSTNFLLLNRSICWRFMFPKNSPIVIESWIYREDTTAWEWASPLHPNGKFMTLWKEPKDCWRFFWWNQKIFGLNVWGCEWMFTDSSLIFFFKYFTARCKKVSF